MTPRFLLVLSLAPGLLALVLWWAGAHMVFVILLGMLAIFLLGLAGILHATDNNEEAMRKQIELLDHEANVLAAAGNPWEYQHRIMSISGQTLPPRPTLTKTGILYGALITEELGETLLALAKSIEASTMDRRGSLFKLANEYAQTGAMLQRLATKHRSLLADCFERPSHLLMNQDHATELLDGLTDLVVVVAGACNAMGLPGAEAYAEVTRSNLSKADPVSGLIAKTPDGKWIKGSNYVAPDLAKLTRHHYVRVSAE